MAFLLAPRFAPAYQVSQCNPFGFCGPSSRPAYTYRISRSQPRRSQYSSFHHFFNQVDEFLSDIDREAQRQAQIDAQRKAHRQRQQRKHALRANFAVDQTEQGWQVNGDIQGFEQENINIEVIDENTLKISGNTQWKAEKTQSPSNNPLQLPEASTHDQSTPQVEPESRSDDLDGVTPDDQKAESTSDYAVATTTAVSSDSDTESHKSYQATVEDDFEDLGAETSSLVSVSSGASTPTEPKEPKGKEKVVDEPIVKETLVAQNSKPEELGQSISQEQQDAEEEEEERAHGSFERTIRFAERIQVENVTASFTAGTLKVIVPRMQVTQVRKVQIM